MRMYYIKPETEIVSTNCDRHLLAGSGVTGDGSDIGWGAKPGISDWPEEDDDETAEQGGQTHHSIWED